MGRTRRRPDRASTEAIEDYLKVAYKLSARGGRATVVAMAARLGVSAPSVTNMVKKLRRLRLVEHAPYGGVNLTARGSRIALEIIRHHRLWELYLARRLGLPLDQVDAEADRLEHVLSDALEERLVALLGDPSEDPHGDPIPTRLGVVPGGPEGRRLSDLACGEVGVVAHLSDREPSHVRAMEIAGLLPGVKVRMDGRDGSDGSVRVRIGGRRRRVRREVADSIRVVQRIE